MNANALNFDINALANPKSIDDLIALANEARAELACFNAHMLRILESATVAEKIA